MTPDHKKRIDIFERVSSLFLIIVFALILLVSIGGDHPIFLVIVGFFPTILTIIISLVIHEEFSKQSKGLWLIPLLTSGGFYALSLAKIPLLSVFDFGVLAGLNFLLSMLYVLVCLGILRKPTPSRKTRPSPQRTHPVKPQPKSIKEYIASIEDKSKAINFAIGRIYSQYHGGSKTLRETLRIPSDWYNSFSASISKGAVINKDEINEILTKFENHFKIFEKKEADVFKKQDLENLHDLIRDPKGKDKIIDVIEHNDKDPVKSYFEGAKTFCKRVRAELGRQELRVVKNEYKGPEDNKQESTTTSKEHSSTKKPEQKESPSKKTDSDDSSRKPNIP
ncbi:MAG: hypothetical protein ACQESC_02715 [Nanobdellota archaeon]